MRLSPRIFPLIALVALSLALPATASAGGSHLLSLYKVEKHIDLEGDGTYSIACNPGDIATDGMWRVDSVDQDNDWPGNILTAVQVAKAAPNGADPAQYDFAIENVAGGDSQVKLFVTCLGASTVGGSHQVSWTVGPRVSQSHTGGPGLSSGFFPPAKECGPGEIAVAPGFNFPNGYDGRLVASRTSLPGDAGVSVGRNWSMVFEMDGNDTYTTYMRCLKLKSSPGPGGHTHKIVVQHVGGSPTPTTSIPATWTQEVQSTCGELYKGMVHGFDTTPSYAQYLWFFGMDPRIKARAYKFYNADPSNPIKVWTGLTCFKDKTT